LIGAIFVVPVVFGLYWVWFSAPSHRTVEALRVALLNGPADAQIEAIPKRHRLDALWSVMRDLLLDDEYEAGRRAVEAVAAIDPVVATAHAEQIAEATGDTDFGVRICRRALEHSPRSLSALATLARILADGGRMDEALAVLDERPDEPDLLGIRAEILEQGGRLA